MKKYSTVKEENLRSKIRKILFNFFPAYRRTGAWICFISSDWKEVHIKLELNWTTKNYVGSVFGGCIYAAVDPIYMLQLIHILGKSFVVWDKAAYIRFKRPIKREVYARFVISDDQILKIQEQIKITKELDIELSATFNDFDNTIYAEIVKTVYIADREYYINKKKQCSI